MWVTVSPESVGMQMVLSGQHSLGGYVRGWVLVVLSMIWIHYHDWPRVQGALVSSIKYGIDSVTQVGDN